MDSTAKVEPNNAELREQLSKVAAELGEGAPQLVPILEQLTACCQRIGQFVEAATYCQKAIAILEKNNRTFSTERIALIRMHHTLGLLHRIQENFEQAEPHYQRALQLSEKQFGERHLETISRQNYLAGLYCASGRYDESEQLLKSSFRFYEESFGKTHDVTAIALYALALVTRRSSYAQTIANAKTQEEVAVAPMIGGECKEFYDRAAKIADIEITKLQVQNPHELFLALMRLSYDRFAESRFDEAEELFRHSLLMEVNEIWPRHPLVSDAYQMLGDLYRSFGTTEQAEYLYKQALDIREEMHHPKLGATALAVGTLLSDANRHDEAESYLQQACRIYRKDEFPPRLANALKVYARVLLVQKRVDEAEAASREADAIFERYGNSNK